MIPLPSSERAGDHPSTPNFRVVTPGNLISPQVSSPQYSDHSGFASAADLADVNAILGRIGAVPHDSGPSIPSTESGTGNPGQLQFSFGDNFFGPNEPGFGVDFSNRPTTVTLHRPSDQYQWNAGDLASLRRDHQEAEQVRDMYYVTNGVIMSGFESDTPDTYTLPDAREAIEASDQAYREQEQDDRMSAVEIYQMYEDNNFQLSADEPRLDRNDADRIESANGDEDEFPEEDFNDYLVEVQQGDARTQANSDSHPGHDDTDSDVCDSDGGPSHTQQHYHTHMHSPTSHDDVDNDSDDGSDATYNEILGPDVEDPDDPAVRETASQYLTAIFEHAAGMTEYEGQRFLQDFRLENDDSARSADRRVQAFGIALHEIMRDARMQHQTHNR